jgi:hypothetical protein
MHVVHWKGFSPVCNLWCTLRFPFSEKALLHTSHIWGLSPVCTLRCAFNPPSLPKPFLHIGHGYGVSASWSVRCSSISYLLTNSTLHTGQRYRPASAVHSYFSFSQFWFKKCSDTGKCSSAELFTCALSLLFCSTLQQSILKDFFTRNLGILALLWSKFPHMAPLRCKFWVRTVLLCLGYRTVSGPMVCEFALQLYASQKFWISCPRSKGCNKNTVVYYLTF